MAAESGSIGDLLKYQGRLSPSTELDDQNNKTQNKHFPDGSPNPPFRPHPTPPHPILHHHLYNRQDSGIIRKPLTLPLAESRLPTLASEDVPEDDGDSNYNYLLSSSDKKRMVRFMQSQQSTEVGKEDEAQIGTFGDLPAVFPVKYSRNRRHTLANVRWVPRCVRCGLGSSLFYRF